MRRIAAKVLFFLTAAISLLLGGPQLWAQPELAGRAEILVGAVTVERAGKQDALNSGDSVFVKDRILTGADSSAEIVLIDLSRMKLAADTSLEITGYEYNPSEKIRHGLLSLTFGKARFAVQDLQEFDDRQFRVQTRTAVVISRDTGFIVAYGPELPRDEVCRDGLATVLCLENSVIVFSPEFPGKLGLLAANMMSQVCGPNLPAPPRFATAAELARVLAGLDRIGNSKITLPGPTGNPEGCPPK
ncbi:MAG: FecR domain-containing protein [Syntrophobacteraceae bacterium]